MMEPYSAKELPMTKRILTVLLQIAVFSTLASAQGYFGRRTQFLTPEFWVIGGSVLPGVQFEHGLSARVGVGGELAFEVGHSGSVIIAPDVAYHFRTNTRDLDLSIGAGPAFAFGEGDSAFLIKPFGSVRYFFSSRIAGVVKLFALFGDGSDFGASFGLSFRL